MVVHTTKSMEAVITSEGSVPVYQSARRCILEEGNLFLIVFDGHAKFAFCMCVCVCVTRKRIGLGTLKWYMSNLGYDLKYFDPFCTLLINPLNAELNPICCLLALLGAHHFLHVSRIRVKSLILRLLMLYIYIYIYMEHLFLMFLDHTQRRTTVGRTPLDE